MASSNRHWPSMFKSKPCNQPWQEMSSPPLLSSPCQKSPYTSGCDQRTPEPKPRWNPKPEQIRILEAIFNSGMVNPPREEIRKIRIQLQQYGQVGDANVFYWFQNRKSRTKNKHRQLLSTRANSHPSIGTNTNAIPTTGIATTSIGILTNVNTASNSNSVIFSPSKAAVPITMTAPTSTSSSSSERSSGSSKPLKPVHEPISVPEPINMYNNSHYSMELSSLSEPFLFQNPHGYCFAVPELTSLIAAPDQVSIAGLGVWSEPMGNSIAITSEEEGVKPKNNAELRHCLGLTNELVNHDSYKGFVGRESGGQNVKIGLHQGCCFQPTDPVAASTAAESVVTAAVPAATGAADVTCGATTVVSCPVNVIQGLDSSSGGSGGAGRCTVFINDNMYEVPSTPLNVKSVFGSNAVLLYPSGYPVATDEFSNTLQPLRHGAFYYVV